MAGEMGGDLSSVKGYLEHAASQPLLTVEEESGVRGGLTSSDDRERMDSRLRLLVANERLVVSIASRYDGKGVPMLELLRAGHDGLVRAVDRLDPGSSYRFSTYATWWIRQAITRAIAEGRSEDAG
jgi:RNA polymerase nonessential primary-like sigma factor